MKTIQKKKTPRNILIIGRVTYQCTANCFPHSLQNFLRKCSINKRYISVLGTANTSYMLAVQSTINFYSIGITYMSLSTPIHIKTFSPRLPLSCPLPKHNKIIISMQEKNIVDNSHGRTQSECSAICTYVYNMI